MNVGLSYGILSPKLTEQLDKMGLKYDEKQMKIFQSELDAINTLRFGSGLVTDSMVDKMLPKLHKKIVAHAAKKSGREVVDPKTRNDITDSNYFEPID